MNPKRIQRKRTKGWKMPLNTIYVGRPSRWSNHYIPGQYSADIDGYIGNRKDAIRAFREWIDRMRLDLPLHYEGYMEPLRGKNLACWCPLDKPCHADVLLELANKESAKP